jgi:hypothetical protein
VTFRSNIRIVHDCFLCHVVFLRSTSLMCWTIFSFLCLVAHVTVEGKEILLYLHSLKDTVLRSRDVFVFCCILKDFVDGKMAYLFKGTTVA